jgi:putative toxin-antitoxin system antitoxin component (TIGR02293 family)
MDTPDLRRLWERLQSNQAMGNDYALLLGLRRFDASSLRARLAGGFSWSAFERFWGNAGLEREALARFLGIPPRTLARRKEQGRLRSDESDRLLRAARLLALAFQLFEGDAAAARGWLTSPQVALGGETPFEFAVTEFGAREVEALIGRLEHGIPS